MMLLFQAWLVLTIVLLALLLVVINAQAVARWVRRRPRNLRAHRPRQVAV